MHQRLLQLSWFFYVKKYPVSKKEDSENDGWRWEWVCEFDDTLNLSVISCSISFFQLMTSVAGICCVCSWLVTVFLLFGMKSALFCHFHLTPWAWTNELKQFSHTKNWSLLLCFCSHSLCQRNKDEYNLHVENKSNDDMKATISSCNKRRKDIWCVENIAFSR